MTMRLKIIFGYNGAEHIIDWWNSIESFPKLLRYNTRPYEWLMYDKDATGTVDYNLTLTELPTYDPNFYAEMEDFNSKYLGSPYNDKCECGSESIGTNLHSYWCPKYK